MCSSDLWVADPALLHAPHHRAPVRLRFLRACLEALDAELRARGIALVVREGDPVALRPGDLDSRARTIQVHGQRVPRAGAGERVAVNLAGLEREQAERGQVLVDPRLDFTTDRFDCWFETRGGAKSVVRSFDRVRVYVGTAEVKIGRAHV